MAAALPETTRTSLEVSYIMDLQSMFDLDTALTEDDDYYIDETVTTSLSVIVANLPTVASHDLCAVCMEDFGPGEGGKKIPCGHVYHQNCISSWLTVGDGCPLCRRRISAGDKT